MRKVMLVVSTAAVAVSLGTMPGSGMEAAADSGTRTGPGAEPDAGAPGEQGPVEADVAHHGHISLWGGRLAVRLSTGNHGPSGLAGATARLGFSVPLAFGQKLPDACLWGGNQVVYCRAGELRADGRDSEVLLDLRTVGDPAEVSVDISTVWNGGADDHNPDNDKHHVLVPATGDLYVY
ncbi:hypothetical protein GCM10011583_28430 [Streptomyces camponoticapitis]|uniref:Uncharacterized protein n=2 Tax=Streptomyces camponoticapitis TaxID=1616125 RepID=A0ABQ2E521_9ACTN|nr:hypothetical protein GCM10011583_28430 [Streptomyces camponoticapitis]